MTGPALRPTPERERRETPTSLGDGGGSALRRGQRARKNPAVVAGEAKARPLRTALEWSDVVRVVSVHEAHRARLQSFLTPRITGVFDMGLRSHREAVARSLTELEDWLETNASRSPLRDSLRGVRRRLEQELWA